MRARRAALLLLAGSAVLGYAVVAPPPPQEIEARLVTKLREHFDTALAHPTAYRQRALAECGDFPEGAIYPFVLPALAYTNLGLRGALPKEEAAAKVRLSETSKPIASDSTYT